MTFLVLFDYKIFDYVQVIIVIFGNIIRTPFYRNADFKNRNLASDSEYE